jgi:hypothetical protein
MCLVTTILSKTLCYDVWTPDLITDTQQIEGTLDKMINLIPPLI